MKKTNRLNMKDISKLSGVSTDDIQKVFLTIENALNDGNTVGIVNFGVFQPKIHKGRVCVLSGRKVNVSDYGYVKFKPSVRLAQSMKDIV